MAGLISLSRRDIDVLGKIRDPESNPENALRLDASLPKDPHITDAAEYDQISQRERDLILVMQQADMELEGLRQKSLADPIRTYRECVADLGKLIAEHPEYASSMNNRAQALRRLYGDDVLVERVDTSVRTINSSSNPGYSRPKIPQAILQGEATNDRERSQAAVTILSDLDHAIALLMPPSTGSTTLSPTAAKTLSMAFTQRAAIYYATSKHLTSGARCNARIERPEAQWSKMQFEEAASRDFAMGGHFGNDIARGLAVGTNPTAKLCGQMVQQMMQGEYGSES